MLIHFPNASATFFHPRERRTKTLGKSMLKPPRVDDTFGSPNAVWPSQISEQSMGIHIRHQCLSLFMVIKLFKLVMRRNIYIVAFSEMVLISWFWFMKGRLNDSENHMKYK